MTRYRVQMAVFWDVGERTDHMFLHPRCALYSNGKGNLFRV